MDMRLAAAICFGLLLSACVPVEPSRPEVPPLKLADCAALYPHADSVPDMAVGTATPSPAELAALGEAQLALARFRSCAAANSQAQDHYLAALGKQLQYDHDQLKSDLAALNKRQEADAAAKSQYQADCNQTGLPEAQYQPCVQRAQDLNAEIAAMGQRKSELNQRQTTLTASIQDFNLRLGGASAALCGDYDAYNAALKTEGAWLDWARNLVNSPEYRGAAAAAGCPDVMTAPNTIDAMHAMADALVACLKRLPAAP